MCCTYIYIYIYVVLLFVCIILIALEQSTAAHGVVSVHTGSGAWGTGVLVNGDIVITCAHVIQKERGVTYLT